MNPSSSEMPGLQLPQPIEQSVPAPEANASAAAAETVATSPERSPSVASAPPPMAVPLPVPQAFSGAGAQPQLPVTSVPAPAVADDTDLIEKEWVAKAKQIVAATRDNPYQQSKDLTVFKADYMQKRYNKIIKLGE